MSKPAESFGANVLRWGVAFAVTMTVAGAGCSESDPKLQLVIFEVDLDPSIAGAPTQSGRYFIRLEVGVINATGEAVPLAFPFFRLGTATGLEITASPSTPLLPAACAADLFVANGQSHTCRLAFEVPNGDSPAQLTVDDMNGHHAEVDVSPCPEDTPDLCDRTCVDFATDPKNCGGCGVAVEGAMCLDGSPTCPAGGSICDDTCVNLEQDPAHCGACSRPVPSGFACHQGAPRCPAGQDDCSGKCVALATDPKNCGQCGHVLPPHGTCVDGQFECTGGKTACNDACVSTQDDPSNCGSCAHDCAADCPGDSSCNPTCEDERCTLQLTISDDQTCAQSCDAVGYRCASATCSPPTPGESVACSYSLANTTLDCSWITCLCVPA